VSGQQDRPEEEPTKFVGRAKPPPLPPATSPYWPRVDDEVIEYVTVPAGRPRRSGLTVTLVVVGVFAACCASGAVLAMFGGALFRAAAVQATPPPAATETPKPTTTRPSRSRGGLDTPVRDGKFEFVVRSFSCGHKQVGKSFVSVKASGQFCIVSLTIKNIGDEGQTFADSFQEAHGPDDKTYRAHTGAGVVANEGTDAVWSTINPGNSVSGKIVFDIPKKAEITSLELHDSALSGGVTVTLT
jgi:hypothetical protein